MVSRRAGGARLRQWANCGHQITTAIRCQINSGGRTSAIKPTWTTWHYSSRMASYKHHSYFQKEKAAQEFRFPYVCFQCRKSFKYPAREAPRICPQCGKQTERLSRKFSAPTSKNIAQWKKVQYLVEHGFRFYSVYERPELGGARVQYPSTLVEAKAFVDRLGNR